MARYRPPNKPGSCYITKEGAQALRDELEQLWRKQRPAVTQAVREAAAQGDRSENAEYLYGKKQLYAIDRRIRHLQKRLDVVTVVDAIPNNQHQVYFGAWVELEDEQGSRLRYRIVGPDEFDLQKGAISLDSPLAQALLKKQVHDEVQVRLPTGVRTYWLVAIRYAPFEQP